jgi:hypothetical protein
MSISTGAIKEGSAVIVEPEVASACAGSSIRFDILRQFYENIENGCVSFLLLFCLS